MRLAVAVAAVLAIGAASGAAIAGVFVRTTGAGGVETYAYVTRENSATSGSSVAYVTIPGATAPVTVTDGSDLILARFSAESACYTTIAGGHWCSVRLVLYNRSNGSTTEMNPQAGLDFAFDSTNDGKDGPNSWESHSMDRSIRVGNGSYYVLAQRAVTNPSVTLRLDDWSLTVEKAN